VTQLFSGRMNAKQCHQQFLLCCRRAGSEGLDPEVKRQWIELAEAWRAASVRPKRSNWLRIWRGGRNESSRPLSGAFLIGNEQIEPFRKLITVSQAKPALFHLEIFRARLGVGREFSELRAMDCSGKTFLLPWSDASKHDSSQTKYTLVSGRRRIR
jgi:hypothetical protein